MIDTSGFEATYWSHSTVRDVERQSIREFVESCSDLFVGRVLDYGCGKQPYRGIVEAAGAEYIGYDRVRLGGNVSGVDIGLSLFGTHGLTTGGPNGLDVILCNQVLQYVEVPAGVLANFRDMLRPNGLLVMTYPTNWDEVEPADLHRFTRAGMERILKAAGFSIDRHDRRAEINLGGFRFPLGYGVVARV